MVELYEMPNSAKSAPSDDEFSEKSDRTVREVDKSVAYPTRSSLRSFGVGRSHEETAREKPAYEQRLAKIPRSEITTNESTIGGAVVSMLTDSLRTIKTFSRTVDSILLKPPTP